MAVAITESDLSILPKLQPLWHRKTPSRLMLDCPAQNPLRGWKAWQEYLAAREEPPAPPFVTGKNPPLLWGWADDSQRSRLRKAVKSPSTLAEVVLADDGVAAPDLAFSLQMVGLAYTLPALARDLPPEPWWNVVERLHDVATQAGQHRVDWPADPRDVLRQQLLGGELPLALGYVFPEVRALHSLKKEARTALSEALVAITDGRGLPHARLLPVLAPLFACWTRTRWLGSRLRHGAWSREAEMQYQWLVRQTIRLADADGTFLLTAPHSGEASGTRASGRSWTKSLFRMALELAGDEGDCAAAAAALPCGIVPKHDYDNHADLPEPSLNSDWSGIAVLAGGWTQLDARLAIAYADDPVRIELSVGGERLLAGAWTSETICDGKPAHVTGEWEMLCWEKNKLHNFLELGVSLSDGLRLERQILFARIDQVLYLADIIISTDGTRRRVQHSCSLPLSPFAQWQPEIETRDGAITGGKQRAAVLPLGMNEWRADPRGGSLAEINRRLVLTQESSGRAMCCPLLLDLDRKRAKKERTWRQLTVGDAMEIVPRDVAVGFRAQSGRDQWLFYRSLGPDGNRTVLGQNIAGEFCAGRFHESGKFKEWIEIETV